MIKTILITGASSGIGKATAKKFSSEGWNVIATMRSPEKEQELKNSNTMLVTKLEVTDMKSIQIAIDAGINKFGKIDALMNNAGFGTFGAFETATQDALKAYLKCKKTKSQIAELMDVDRSTIYRELNRNSRKRGGYDPDFANVLAVERKERFCTQRKFNLNTKKLIDHWVTEEQWSPEQIVGYCRKVSIPMVSHERIYQYIRRDKLVGGKLYKHMRHQLKHRKRPVSGKHQIIKNKVSIDERPEVINNKERFGDWEIDLIVDKNNKGAMVTLVERTTAMVMIHKLEEGKNANGVADAVLEMLIP